MTAQATPAADSIISDFRANMSQGMTISEAATHATHEANELAEELRGHGLPWQAVNDANAWWNTEADWTDYV